MEQRDFSDGLYALALEPESLGEFAAFFNPFFEDLEGDEAGQKLVAEDRIIKAMVIADLLIDQENQRNRDLHHTITHALHPMLALDVHGKVIEINSEAIELLGIDRDLPHFRELLTQESRNLIDTHIRQLSQYQRAGRRDYVDLIELETRGSELPKFCSISQWEVGDDRYCLFLQFLEVKWPRRLTSTVQQKFGFTQSETEVFILLCEGSSAQDIAERRQTSIATVRTQIRELYAKTGTQSLSQFLRLALSMAALTFDKHVERTLYESEAADSKITQPSPSQDHWNTFILPDGRALDYAVFGASDGAPCVYYHGEQLGHIWPADMAEYAASKRLQIILPARPFYRGSSAYPDDCHHPTQTAHDFKALFDHLGLGEISILSQALGGMFALQFLHFYPERVISFCAVTPVLPMGSAEQRLDMPVMQRFVATVVQKSPRLLEFVARAGYALYLRKGPAAYLHRAFGNLDCDRAILENPDHLKSLSIGTNFAAGNNVKAYVAGFQHVLHDALEKMIESKAKFQFIIGGADQNTRHARAQSLIDAGADIEIITAENGGELLMYTHSKLIVETVLKHGNKE
ncbi:MAG: alpha/beta fold hydrolase [Erythrobacter sp.]